MVALALVQQFEQLLIDRLASTSSFLSAPGSAVYALLRESGIDGSSVASVYAIFSEVIKNHEEYFPNTRSLTDLFVRFLDLLFPDQTPLSQTAADRWMLVLYQQEERTWNATNRSYEQRKCSNFLVVRL